MALPLEKLGMMYSGHRAVIDPDRAKAYAAATNDEHPGYVSGACVPPVFAAVATWDALTRVVADVVPPEAVPNMVHGEQDMYLYRPLVANEVIATTARPYCVRVGRSSTRVTFQLTSVDEKWGQPVLCQYVTLVLQGVNDGTDGGPDKPSHVFDGRLGDDAEAVGSFHVDRDQTFRYREVSGDDMPIHLDAAYARSLGLPGIVVHGLCTMAMAGRVVVQTVGGGDPGRLRRLAVRFCGLVLPGDDVRVRIHRSRVAHGESAHRRYHFEAEADRGDTVLCHGLAEVGAPRPGHRTAS